MRWYAPYASILLGIGFSSSIAYAQMTTDVAQSVGGVLTRLGPKPVTINYTERESYEVCRTTKESDYCVTRYRDVAKSRVENQILTASNITIAAPQPPRFSTPIFTSFPDQLVSTTQENLNCSSVPGSANVSLSLSAARSYSVTVTKSVTNTVGGSVMFTVPVGAAAVQTSVNVSQSRTSATAVANGVANTYTITGAGTVAMPARSRTISVLSSYKVRTTVPFSLMATVDADLSSNNAGWKKLSEVASDSDRTFEIAGEIVSDESAAGTLSLLDAPFDAARCSRITGIQTSPDVSLSNLRLAPSNARLLGAVVKTER